jgi:hypothetical protein
MIDLVDITDSVNEERGVEGEDGDKRSNSVYRDHEHDSDDHPVQVTQTLSASRTSIRRSHDQASNLVNRAHQRTVADVACGSSSSGRISKGKRRWSRPLCRARRR